MADWIRTPFGMESGVGLGMGVLDFGGDRRRGRGSVGLEFAASHCNQRGLCCVIVWKCVQRSSCRLSYVVSGVGPGIHVLDGSPHASRKRGCFWHGFRHFAKIRLH